MYDHDIVDDRAWFRSTLTWTDASTGEKRATAKCRSCFNWQRSLSERNDSGGRGCPTLGGGTKPHRPPPSRDLSEMVHFVRRHEKDDEVTDRRKMGA